MPMSVTDLEHSQQFQLQLYGSPTLSSLGLYDPLFGMFQVRNPIIYFGETWKGFSGANRDKYTLNSTRNTEEQFVIMVF